MQDVGESWLMTSLTLSPLLVALVETAGSLPVVLAALPAGALADIVDRRRLLIVMQVWMGFVATAMGVMTIAGHMTTGRLLSMTFLLGIGSAVSNPVWQAITPELVPSEDLPAALSLGGVAVNIARAVGPAIGGLIIAASGPWIVFFINAVSFLAVFLVVYRWQPAPRTSKLPPEEIISAMRAGTRYLRHSPELQTVLLRCAVFIICASGFWVWSVAWLPGHWRHCRSMAATFTKGTVRHESLSSRRQHRLRSKRDCSGLRSFISVPLYRFGHGWDSLDLGTGESERCGADSNSRVGARAGAGCLFISIHWRPGGWQCPLGFRGRASRNIECTSNFGERARNRITLNLALPSGRQKEFVTHAFNALAGTGDENRE